MTAELLGGSQKHLTVVDCIECLTTDQRLAEFLIQIVKIEPTIIGRDELMDGFLFLLLLLYEC